MESPVNLVRHFYESFARLDHAGMCKLYEPGISFLILRLVIYREMK